jgi:uncharacterized phiE125 gp8 family phage protein
MLQHTVRRIVEPDTEPLTLPGVKRHCNVIAEDEDALLWSLIHAAREQVETEANRSLVTQTWRMRLHTFPSDRYIELPRPPLIAVTSIVYVDSDGVAQTVDDDDYDVDADREPGAIWLAEDVDWPSDLADQANAVTITYTAGYGDPDDVPRRAKQAMLLLVGHWYRQREAVGTSSFATEIPLAYRALINSLRVGVYP